jgi:hypothetical protein
MTTMRYSLMEIARIGALFIPGDMLEEVMPPERRDYPVKVQSKGKFALSDEIDFMEHNFNALKKVLLLIERIDPTRNLNTALWILRPENPVCGEVMVAGGALPIEGVDIQEMWPEINRAFTGTVTRWDRPVGQTVYYPIRNSNEDIIGVLELSHGVPTLFI